MVARLSSLYSMAFPLRCWNFLPARRFFLIGFGGGVGLRLLACCRCLYSSIVKRLGPEFIGVGTYDGCREVSSVAMIVGTYCSEFQQLLIFLKDSIECFFGDFTIWHGILVQCNYGP